MMARRETYSRSQFRFAPNRGITFSDGADGTVDASPTRSAPSPPTTAGRGRAGRMKVAPGSQGGLQ